MDAPRAWVDRGHGWTGGMGAPRAWVQRGLGSTGGMGAPRAWVHRLPETISLSFPHPSMTILRQPGFATMTRQNDDNYTLSYVYTLRLIGPISYPGECDLMVHPQKYYESFSRMHFVTFVCI